MARVEVSIVFESGARIGPDNARLLESIRETGSISAAARQVGMPYKKAWMLLDGMNHAFIEPVITAAPGGAGGGGATLTDFGAEVLERYQRAAKQGAEMAGEHIAALARRLNPKPAQKSDLSRRGLRSPRRRRPQSGA